MGNGALSARQDRLTPVPTSRSRLDHKSAGFGADCPFPHTHLHLAAGYLRGRDSARPIGRSPAALAVGGGVMTHPGRPRRALRGARVVLSGTFIGRREEPAAALEAGDELGILQAPQQLGHGAPGPPLPPPHQGPLLAQSPTLAPAGLDLRADGGRGPGRPPTGAPLGS